MPDCRTVNPNKKGRQPPPPRAPLTLHFSPLVACGVVSQYEDMLKGLKQAHPQLQRNTELDGPHDTTKHWKARAWDRLGGGHAEATATATGKQSGRSWSS